MNSKPTRIGPFEVYDSYLRLRISLSQQVKDMKIWHYVSLLASPTVQMFPILWYEV